MEGYQILWMSLFWLFICYVAKWQVSFQGIAFPVRCVYSSHVRFVSYVNTVQNITHVTTCDSSLWLRCCRMPIKTSNVLSDMRGMAEMSYIWDLQAASSNLVILWERCVLACPLSFLDEFCGHALALAVSKPPRFTFFKRRSQKTK